MNARNTSWTDVTVQKGLRMDKNLFAKYTNSGETCWYRLI